MSTAAANGSSSLKSNGHSSKKATIKQDEIRPKIVHSSPLQIKLEGHTKKSRTSNGTNGVITAQPNGIARYKNTKTRRHKSGHKQLFSMDSDSEEELTITRFDSKSPKVSITQNSKELAECEERLLKDGYRLDEMSDEEDLDLIPPRHMDHSCCANFTPGCILS